MILREGKPLDGISSLVNAKMEIPWPKSVLILSAFQTVVTVYWNKELLNTSYTWSDFNQRESPEWLREQQRSLSFAEQWPWDPFLSLQQILWRHLSKSRRHKYLRKQGKTRPLKLNRTKLFAFNWRYDREESVNELSQPSSLITKCESKPRSNSLVDYFC